MKTLPLRLPPESDIRVAPEQAVASRSCNAAFVLSGIGNLRQTRLRRAGVTEVNTGFAELVVRGASHRDNYTVTIREINRAWVKLRRP